MSDVWLSRTVYIGPKSGTERLGKTRIGTKVAHVTRDSDTIFKVNLQGWHIVAASRTACFILRGKLTGKFEKQCSALT